MGYEDFRPLRDRSFRFAVDIAGLCRTLPRTWEGVHIRGQLFAAATSVAANYRAASRGRSPAEFIAKMGLVVEESDESEFWLVFLAAVGLRTGPDLDRLTNEAGELVAIFAASLRTAKENARRKAQEERERRRTAKRRTPPR